MRTGPVRSAWRILVWKSKGNRPLVRSRRMREGSFGAHVWRRCELTQDVVLRRSSLGRFLTLWRTFELHKNWISCFRVRLLWKPHALMWSKFMMFVHSGFVSQVQLRYNWNLLYFYISHYGSHVAYIFVDVTVDGSTFIFPSLEMGNCIKYSIRKFVKLGPWS